MIVEKLKYTIWASDAERAAAFYTRCFGGHIVRQNPHITEIAIAGGLIAIHGGGEGKRTWTGITMQVDDVVKGAAKPVRRESGPTAIPPARGGVRAEPNPIPRSRRC